MSDEIRICLDCNGEYTFSGGEKARFENLMKTVSGFQMPKRCFNCRRERRNGPPLPPPAPAPAPSYRGTRLASAKPLPVSSPPPPPPVSRAPKEGDVRLVLATVDFENLVAGRPVSWQGVTVLLADIGYKAMHEAIDRVEQEKFDVRWNR